MKRLQVIAISLLLCCVMWPTYAASLPLTSRSDVDNFITFMVEQHHFDRSELMTLFDQVELQPEIRVMMDKPFEAKPWHVYRNLYVNNKRIDGGVRFWEQHAEDLARAEEIYGVPASMIVAIIGIESTYGERQGRYRVIDALSTLAFNYPRRAKFFQSELCEFLLLTRDGKIDPLKPLGSHAGAIGQPQFMPSSYRHFAVDFSGSGKKDLMNNSQDVIGSVANYFQQHGWVKGRLVALPASLEGQAYDKLLTSESHHAVYRPDRSLAELKNYGISSPIPLSPQRLAHVIKLEGEEKPEYWLGFHNFYVITRYNSSKLYAMAALQLSREIQRKYEATNNIVHKNESESDRALV